MARMLAVHMERYRAFGAWLRDELPLIPEDRPDVWQAFLDNCPLTPDQAREGMRFGTDPIVFVESLPGAFGVFDPGRPRVITIDRSLVDGPGNLVARPKVGATVLHEMVHWGWCAAKRSEPAEMGTAFEEAAFGMSAPPPAARDPDDVPDTEPLREATEEVGREPGDDGENLGALSRSYESNGRPWAIGHDSTGGWSYGLYQLAAAQGTVGRFLVFLGRAGAAHPEYREFLLVLENAGGASGARSGAPAFHNAWRALAARASFSKAQHDFIKASHYDPFVNALLPLGIDVDRRSPVLRDVAWSVAVQHGQGGTEIFERAMDALPAPDRADDAALIKAVYAERSRVDVYFRSSTASVKASVKKRFQRERADALAAQLTLQAA